MRQDPIADLFNVVTVPSARRRGVARRVRLVIVWGVRAIPAERARSAKVSLHRTGAGTVKRLG